MAEKTTEWHLDRPEAWSKVGVDIFDVDGDWVATVKPDHRNLVVGAPEMAKVLMCTDFGWALQRLRGGEKVCREEWPDGLFLHLREGITPFYSEVVEFSDDLMWIGIVSETEGFVPWTPSRTDLLAEDWAVAE